MSAAWSWFIIICTIASMLACFWLIVWTNRQHQPDSREDLTTGHSWDGLTELNNPLPMWWLWLFVITLVFGFGYFAIFPGLGNFSGLASWSQVQRYEREVAAAEAKYGPMFATYGAMPVGELLEDPKALAIGQSLFANYCAQCHGSLGRGAPGFPNLTDQASLYGSEPQQIELSILNGRAGVMPAMAAALGSEESVDAMVTYVQRLPDAVDTKTPAHTQYLTFCSGCHGPDGGGMTVLGAPSLKDDAWLYGGSDRAIRQSIVEGRNGVMPAHRDLIGPDRARILTAYVYSLSRPAKE